MCAETPAGGWRTPVATAETRSTPRDAVTARGPATSRFLPRISPVRGYQRRRSLRARGCVDRSAVAPAPKNPGKVEVRRYGADAPTLHDRHRCRRRSTMRLGARLDFRERRRKPGAPGPQSAAARSPEPTARRRRTGAPSRRTLRLRAIGRGTPTAA